MNKYNLEDVLAFSDRETEGSYSSNKAILVIDIQEDYTGAAAKPPFPYKDSEKLIDAVNKIIKEASKQNIMVVYIKQEFEGLFGKMHSKLFSGGATIKGIPGTEIDRRVTIVSNHFFSKRVGNAFSNPELEACLNEYQVNELYLVGLDAAGCVYLTANGALKRGYSVNVVTDSVTTKFKKTWNILVKICIRKGINLISSQDLFEFIK